MNRSDLILELGAKAVAPSIYLAFVLSVAHALRDWTRLVHPGVDAAWLTAERDASPAATEMIGRYLRRVRSHRLNGAIIGGGLTLLRGLSHGRSISIGIGPGSPLNDVLLGGLAGLLVGSVLAETWRIKPTGTVREAELAPRSPEPGAASLRGAVVILTATTVLLGLASHEARPLVLAATSLVLLGTHWVVLRAIAERGRPALPPDLRQADDAIRRFASRRLTIETVAAAVLLVGWQLASVPSLVPDLLSDGLILVSFVVTIVLVHRSRPWPPRRPDQVGPPSLVA